MICYNELKIHSMNLNMHVMNIDYERKLLMKTDECTLNGSRKDIEKALELVEKIAEYNGLSRKEMLQLRLLAEEILGMQAGIMGFAKGTFYMENKERVYNIYFHTELDEIHQLQDKFVEMSTSGENAAYSGFMGKIRYMIDNIQSNPGCGFYQADSSAGDSMAYNYSLIDYDRIWELSRYRRQVRKNMEQWDELEKSVVASIADELIVGARNNCVDMIVVKEFH